MNETKDENFENKNEEKNDKNDSTQAFMDFFFSFGGDPHEKCDDELYERDEMLLDENSNIREDITINNSGENEAPDTYTTDSSNAHFAFKLENEEKETNVNYTQSPMPKTKVNNKGLKVFSFVLAAVLLIALSCAGTYVITKNQFNKASKSDESSKITLESKPDSNALSASEVYKKVNPSVVNIITYNENNAKASTMSSGIIYTADGYVITNDHIYENIAAPKFIVTTSDGTRYNATFVAGDSRSDLAVLKIENSGNLTPATFGNSDEALVGEQVAAIGYTTNVGDASIFTNGIISANGIRTSVSSSYSSKYIQTDTAINPGNSGGPLTNMYGQVIGVTCSKIVSNTYDAIGYAIPMNTVQKTVDKLIKYGYVKGRAKLGITYSFINIINSKINSCPVGLYIDTVSEESDLYGTEVKKGDIITYINDTEITSSDSVLDVIEAANAGDQVTLTIYNSETKASYTIKATLIEDVGSSSYTENETNQSESNDKILQ